MDLSSSLRETQLQQEEQQQVQQQTYDPQQVQSYYQQYPHPPLPLPLPSDYTNSYQQPSYHHSYYQQPDYTNNTSSYPHYQNDAAAPILPPGVTIPAPQQYQQQQQQQQQQGSYYPLPNAAEQNPPSSYPVPSGLNPAAAAAVAALSQLTQFAGTMDAAERAMAGLHDRQWQGGNDAVAPGMQLEMPPHMYHQGGFPAHRGGRPPYRSGGRRGGPPFRGGGGRGNFGHRPPRSDGSTPQFYGRGRGRGGNWRAGQRATSSHVETVPTGEQISVPGQRNVEASAVMQGEAPVSTPVPPSATAPGQAQPQKASSTRRPPQIAWCELCRVDCTSLDILEQHKNGKKHKKNMLRIEELQKRAGYPMPVPMTLTNLAPPPLSTDPASAPAPAPSAASALTVDSAPSLVSSVVSEIMTTSIPGVQNQQESLPEFKLDVITMPGNVEGGEINKSGALEKMSTELVNGDIKVEAEQKNDMGHAEVEVGEPNEAPGRKRRLDRSDARKRGMNKKMRGGRGDKRTRNFDRPTRPVEPPKPKEVVPIVCDLCNVKCDTQAVFQTHLVGKKHAAKLKRFQGHQAMFGPLGLQALYPPNPNTQPIFIPQVHQQNMYPSQGSFHQPVSYALPLAQQAATVSQPQVNQVAETHGAHAIWDGSQNVVEGQQGSGVVQESQLVARSIPETSLLVTEEKAVNIASEPPVLPPPENTIMGFEQIAPAKDVALTVDDYGVTTPSERCFSST